jgi:poly-gamma-glutamate synthesis protein (capsule biosynthesis protein)
MRRLAEALVSAGADVVWNHSAHHVLPLEEIRGRHVIYGTGRLVDDYEENAEYRSDLAMIVKITFSPDETQGVEVVPIRVWSRRPQILDRDDSDYDFVMDRAGLPRVRAQQGSEETVASESTSTE